MSNGKVAVTVAAGRTMAAPAPGSSVLDPSDPTGTRVMHYRLRSFRSGEVIEVDAAAVRSLVASGFILDPISGEVEKRY